MDLPETCSSIMVKWSAPELTAPLLSFIKAHYMQSRGHLQCTMHFLFKPQSTEGLSHPSHLHGCWWCRWKWLDVILPCFIFHFQSIPKLALKLIRKALFTLYHAKPTQIDVDCFYSIIVIDCYNKSKNKQQRRRWNQEAGQEGDRQDGGQTRRPPVDKVGWWNLITGSPHPRLLISFSSLCSAEGRREVWWSVLVCHAGSIKVRSSGMM